MHVPSVPGTSKSLNLTSVVREQEPTENVYHKRHDQDEKMDKKKEVILAVSHPGPSFSSIYPSFVRDLYPVQCNPSVAFERLLTDKVI